MVATSTTRVEGNTDPDVNRRIRDEMQERIAQFETANLHDISYHLAELDHEWDIERVLEMNFAGVVLGGMALATLRGRKWLLLPFMAGCFMVQHVVEGWCPPLAILRRMGFRTANEIHRERTALKIIRGDFAHLGVPTTQGGSASQESLLDAVEQ